jgi:hypothetical protein
MIYTSNYRKSAGHPNAVGISRGVPGFYKGKRCSLLFPPSWMVRKDKAPTPGWEEAYKKDVLSKLDPMEVLAEIGDNAVLLCFEEMGQPCHRHIAARWLADALACEVQELDSVYHTMRDARSTGARIESPPLSGTPDDLRVLRLRYDTFPSGHGERRKIQQQMAGILQGMRPGERASVPNEILSRCGAF